ncbi:MAG: ABC transporter ATP-binding protein [Candidatus Dadabacteria bacterium]|nr:MAG: ABC transporter ATP-binding protein [Candidatus Dadabacteria bacterium]
MLKVNGIDVFYGDVQVLWDVSFHVAEGEVVALIGANGAGKSTTLRTISGLLRPRKGTIEFLGERLDRTAPYRIIELGLAHVPEARRLFPEMTVEENLEMGALKPAAKARRAESLERVYERFPRLKERRRQLAGTLSGGEQQMLAIGRGLMSLPRMILFDEPSLGLAPLLVEEVFQVVEEIRRDGVTVLIVEQNVRQTLAVADRAYVLETGRIVREGTGRELLDDEEVRRAYLGV